LNGFSRRFIKFFRVGLIKQEFSAIVG